MLTLLFGIVIVGAVSTLDATLAAFVAGVFSVFNTLFLIKLQKPVKATHKAITAPRRIVYDSAGNPVGTVLDLRGDPEFAIDTVATQRRHTDEQ